MQYVASPYSNPDKNIEQLRYYAALNFCASAARQGLYVYSPIVHWHAVALKHSLPTDAAFWDKFNMTMLRRADGIILLKLPGWETSRGCARELSVAETLNIPLTVCAMDLPEQCG